MQPKTSRDLPPSPPKKDEQREQERAAVKDAGKTEQADWDRVHGKGDTLDLDKP